MQRRSVLVGSVGLLGGLSGCAGVLGDGSSSADDSPTDVATAFLEALLAGNVDEADAYVHAESRMKGQLGAMVDSFGEQSTRLEGTTLSEKSETAAVVDAQTTIAVDGVDSREDSRLIVVLHRVDSAWRVDLLTTPGFGGGGPSAPSVLWESRERTADDGNTTAVVFEHDGGDTFDGTSLSVSVDDAIAPAPVDAGSVETGVQIVAPVDADGSSIGAGSTVRLRWSDASSETEETLTSHVLSEATVGSLGPQLGLE